ncbi:adhesin [Luteimonas sp. BDR2-5]|uniref:adhesin n=1 Tax=Proluteimonas luteida TaxID=2878685 RepID=UPI001E5CF391|nr:adhesin [Luteimonas sp. BDR2-5]MCD9027941.1 adhesin [Luteimonas sp. BDR2-5]
MKWTVLAVAVTAATAGVAQAQSVDWRIVDYDITIDDVRNYETNVTNTNTEVNTTVNENFDWNQSIDQSLTENYSIDVSQSIDQSLTETYTLDVAQSLDEAHRIRTNQVYENIERTENVNSDVRRERNEHGVSVNIDKDISLSSDIAFSGDPTITGNIDLDSAAIALIDNRQSVSGNIGLNDKLDNTASIDGDVGSEASGNLAFNVAAGDNNVQDNAAALSAADASFAFGLADAEIFVNQSGSGNLTMNEGVRNDASLGGNAFSAASGNIGVNVAAGNNNAQKNALAASVATAAYAQATVSSNQSSSGNVTSNQGSYQKLTDTVQVSLAGPVRGLTQSVGIGAYEGQASGSTASTGNAYQQTNFYADMWQGELHPHGPVIGHADYDIDSQGAVANPYRQGVGGLAFDTDSEGSYSGSESGALGFVELGYSDLQASLSGTVTTSRWVAVAATNDASLSGSAFSQASGNIGVNVAAGTGNLQANSLSLAVAQPSTAAPPPTNGGE